MFDGLMWIASRKGTVGLVVHRGVVVDAPPMGRRWAMGRRAWEVNELAQERGATVVWLPGPDDPAVPVGRPEWFEAWLPVSCANGHPLGRGTTNSTFVNCHGCPATHDERGHHLYRCRTNGCDAPFIPPPEHRDPT